MSKASGAVDGVIPARQVEAEVGRPADVCQRGSALGEPAEQVVRERELVELLGRRLDAGAERDPLGFGVVAVVGGFLEQRPNLRRHVRHHLRGELGETDRREEFLDGRPVGSRDVRVRHACAEGL